MFTFLKNIYNYIVYLLLLCYFDFISASEVEMF